MGGVQNNMKNIAVILNEKIIEKRSVTCVGLDPILEKIPECYKEKYRQYENEFEAVGEILFDFNKDIIDCVADLVPTVKPQIAFYEQYGIYGLKAFDRTVKYPKSIFLVPGYGTQGGKAGDIINCFNEDGLGAVVNASRSIIYAYMDDKNVDNCKREQYKQSVTNSTQKMNKEIYEELLKNKQKIRY